MENIFLINWTWTDVNFEKKEKHAVFEVVMTIRNTSSIPLNMSVIQRVKRFFANTIHGYGEVFKVVSHGLSSSEIEENFAI